MAKMTRTEKYKELRESLQHDFGEEMSTKDLAGYESLLHAIDANNFAAPGDVANGDHDAAHGRKDYSAETAVDEDATEEIDLMTRRLDTVYDTGYMDKNVNDTSAGFGDDYLDHVISEVKKYNIDQGNAVSENTQLNILRGITVEDSPVRPYVHTENTEKKSEDADTADIPFKSAFAGRTAALPKLDPDTERTVADISAQVLGMMDEEEIPEKKKKERTYDDSIEVGFPSAQATRQQMLNQTMTMRQQLDDYEDNLTEVTDRMHHTNRILNIVLIVLIAALSIVLVAVIWMILATN